MTEAFSVTSVRVAVECPRLFYLGERFQTKTLFLPPDASGLGSAFHHLSEQCIRCAQEDDRVPALFAAEADWLDEAAIAIELRQIFYDRVIYPYLQREIPIQADRGQALLSVWEGLQGLIQRWAAQLIANRRYCSAADLIGKTFLGQELTVQHTFELPNGETQLVRGRLDSLVYDFEQHRLCVVEYKTYPTIDPAAELVQVALYSLMLKERVGVAIDSAIYRVLPEWREETFTWEQLADALHHRIPQKLQQMREWQTWEPSEPNPPPPTNQPDRLCPICPQFTRCQTFFSEQALQVDEHKPARLPRLEPNPADWQPDPSPTSADAMGEALVQTLQSFGVAVSYQGAAIGPAFVRVRLKPQLGVKVGSLLRLSDDLRVQMGLTEAPLISPQAGYVSVDLPRRDRQTARFEQYIRTEAMLPTDPMQIAIGVDLNGTLIEADLSDPNTCHFLVGGTTGSGKSEFLRSLLLSLIVRHPPEQLQIALVDPKRVTFPEFEQMPWLYDPVVKDPDRAIDLMADLVEEMDSRYQRFEAAGCSDLRAYNARVGRQPTRLLPRILCIFDEYADLMAERATSKALEQSIKRLGAMARAAGIHLIIATQRPEAKVVTPLIRSNLPGRIALRTASEADSAIVLGGKQTAAACLLGKGDLLYQSSARLLRLQSLFAGKVQLSRKR